MPYKNVPALVGYYLGVFSLILLVGLLLFVPAIVLGIMEVVRAARHPGSRGLAHAITAIILGVVSPLELVALAYWIS